MRSNYIGILNNRVEIPIIQRDYAQGRTDPKTSKIRKDFLDAIFEFILLKRSSPEAELDLDFIYGLNKTSSFIPIDGQQRLTTLWLLYWFVTAREKVKHEEKAFLKNFMYETRHSTTQFCKSLISFTPEFTQDTIAEEIKNQSWYFEAWHYDPGIRAMLVVLNDIEQRYLQHELNGLWNLIGNTACPFYFYKLDMDKVGLTDDLYIKMNSRGKALTEFEYFKAGFTELLKESQREKFETSIDGIWMDTIWQIVFERADGDEDEDIAQAADQAFLNLFNFISSVLSFKQDIKAEDDDFYEDTETTPELIKRIYADVSNQNYLIETLDSICKYQKDNAEFWNNVFYYKYNGFEKSKTRLFFQHGEVNLLSRCIFHFDEYRGLTFPERIILLAVLAHFRNNDDKFEKHIRVVRNLAVNSEFELRETSLGKSYEEVEQYILSGDLNVLNSFKTDQIKEEKDKHEYSINSIEDIPELRHLEDSDIFRGSITLILLDENFPKRASLFLKLFDEDSIISDYNEKCNLLLCFGDYSQADGILSNLLAANKSDIRKFFTTPGYNKSELYANTQIVMTSCLDFFCSNPTISVSAKIEQTLSAYENAPKDWRYYFLKYPSFKDDCKYGYYEFLNDYPKWKMGKKRFNGYHWDPFLHELFLSDVSGKVSLGNYGTYEKLVVTKGRTKVHISSHLKKAGFFFENGNTSVDDNPVLNDLVAEGFIEDDHTLLIDQDTDGYDNEDRVEKLKSVIGKITG